MRVYLTQEKKDKFVRAAQDLLSKRSVSIREVAGIIGLMGAYSQAYSYGGVHEKDLEREKDLALKLAAGDFDKSMVLSQEARLDVLWWLENIDNSGRAVRCAKHIVTVFTDASEEGWGAHVDESATGGRWSDEEKKDHINILELRAIYLGLSSLCRVQNSHIRVMADNTTALAYVKHQGCVKSPECQREAKEIWLWAELENNWMYLG